MIDPSVVFSSFPAGRVLDVATGRGSFIHHLLGCVRDLQEIIGVDQEDMSEAFSQAFADQPVSFRQMDAQALEFPPGSFDTVCICNSLHHLAEPAGSLFEMRRVLKTGGRLAVWEMCRDVQVETQQTHVDLHHWWAAVDRATGVRHNPTYTRAELVELVKPLGLHDLLVDDYTDLSENPRTPETVSYLQGVIDQYLGRLDGIAGVDDLCQMGQALRQRVADVGFHGATSILLLGVKP